MTNTHSTERRERREKLSRDSGTSKLAIGHDLELRGREKRALARGQEILPGGHTTKPDFLSWIQSTCALTIRSGDMEDSIVSDVGEETLFSCISHGRG